MIRDRFTTSFFINKLRIVHGEAIVQCRVSFRGKSKTFSTKLKIRAEHWDAKVQVLKKNDPYSKLGNHNLDKIKSNLFQALDHLINERTYFTVDDLIDYTNGSVGSEKFLLESYREYILKHKKPMVDAGKRSSALLQKHERTFTALNDFVKTIYNKTDVDLRTINYEFLSRFLTFLQTTENMCNNTAQKNMQRFRELFLYCSSNGWIKSDPFKQYKFRFEEVDRMYLSKHELNSLESFQPDSQSLTLMKDVFLFSCYTGLAYADIKKLKMSDFKQDGKNVAITIKRKKTNVVSYIPLLDEAKRIIDKYSFCPQRTVHNLALPVISNQKSNQYIKVLLDLCGIDKAVTFHGARHTFATYMLTLGVSMEAVSKMLGHKDLRTTLIYARILNSKVDDDMDKVRAFRKRENGHEGNAVAL